MLHCKPRSKRLLAEPSRTMKTASSRSGWLLAEPAGPWTIEFETDKLPENWHRAKDVSCLIVVGFLAAHFIAKTTKIELRRSVLEHSRTCVQAWLKQFFRPIFTFFFAHFFWEPASLTIGQGPAWPRPASLSQRTRNLCFFGTVQHFWSKRLFFFVQYSKNDGLSFKNQ